MEYSFVVKHIKGSSNNVADNLSRLPIVDSTDMGVPFPMVHDTADMALPDSIKSPAINKIESEIMFDVKI